QSLAGQIEEMKRQRQAREKSLAEEMKELEKEKVRLEEMLEKLQTQIRCGVDEMADKVREQVPLLAALSTGLRAAHSVSLSRSGAGLDGRAAENETAVLWGDLRPVPPTKELEDVRDESPLVDHLVAELAANHLSFTRDFIANLYVCFKAGSLNLLTG